eukprot:m.315504 g.315504  ORF g.315504 m.315504 type:complete len:98 (+) comp20276_c1_seq32:1207-1500(+)
MSAQPAERRATFFAVHFVAPANFGRWHGAIRTFDRILVQILLRFVLAHKLLKGPFSISSVQQLLLGLISSEHFLRETLLRIHNRSVSPTRSTRKPLG